MTRQYRINTTNMHPTGPDDCYLEPDDPVHALKAASIMGGLGGQARLAQYNELTQQKITDQLLTQRNQAQTQGVRPGSPAWHAMFDKP